MSPASGRGARVPLLARAYGARKAVPIPVDRSLLPIAVRHAPLIHDVNGLECGLRGRRRSIGVTFGGIYP